MSTETKNPGATTEDIRIAQTILNQLGRTTQYCLGAKDFVAIESGVEMRTTNYNGLRIRIVLDPSDTYRIETYKVRKAEAKVIDSIDFIYNDQLAEQTRKLADAPL